MLGLILILMHVIEFCALTFILFLWKGNSLCYCEVLYNNKPDGQRPGDEMYVWADGSPAPNRMD